MPKVATPAPEHRADPTENARRAARFKFAKRRIEQIVSTAPRLTPEQFAELRGLLPAPTADAGR